MKDDIIVLIMYHDTQDPWVFAWIGYVPLNLNSVTIGPIVNAYKTIFNTGRLLGGESDFLRIALLKLIAIHA